MYVGSAAVLDLLLLLLRSSADLELRTNAKTTAWFQRTWQSYFAPFLSGQSCAR